MIIKLQEAEVSVASPARVYELLQVYFKTLDAVDRDKEYFLVLHLDVRNRMKLYKAFGSGERWNFKSVACPSHGKCLPEQLEQGQRR